jgi:hypothetical protein
MVLCNGGQGEVWPEQATMEGVFHFTGQQKTNLAK